MTKRILITGNSSGLGMGLTKCYLARNWSVYGLSRRGNSGLDSRLRDIKCDLANIDAIPTALDVLLDGVEKLDLVILNAGVLGRIKDMGETSIAEIREVMDINVWANKQIMDWLLQAGIAPAQVVMISSGAAVNGNRGWGAYSLSKATLNMLAKLYSREFLQTHICALAPGLVDTAMQDFLCDEVTDPRFSPSADKLRAARGTPAMPTPEQAGALIADAIPSLKSFPSGDFIDIRNL